jgi:uncharacterized protein with von Willebrand factor type A (vWA) domain
LTEFIRALRANDVRISTSESIDAGAALQVVGYEDREVLRHALAQALAKSEDEKQAFAETFDRFFAFDQFTETPVGAGAGEQQAEHDPDGQPAPQPQGGTGMPGTGGSGEGTEPSPDGPMPDLATLLESGDQARLQMALAEAARQVNLNRIRLFTQRGIFARRIMEAMGLEGLERVIAEAASSPDPVQQARAAQLDAAREALRLQVRDYVEKQLKLFTANTGRQLREEVLQQIRLSNIDLRDMKIMRDLVAKMAKRLIALHSRRRKVAKRGQLDVRRTIRANIEFDGLLFHTVWKKTRIARPKVMAVCDVSGSVANVARFLLMFLYSLQEVLPEVRSFAFSDRLGEVTKLFDSPDIDQALTEALQKHGGGSTDYGQAFVDLEALAMDDIDHRTTVLILGDARSNYGDPRADLLHMIHDRAKRVLFLNPEPRSLWRSGDSEMRKLAPYCDRAVTCASLKDLERVVSDLLRTAV